MIQLLPGDTVAIIASAGQELPSNWLGVLGLVILTVPGTIGALAALVAGVVALRNRQKVGDLQTNVKAVSTNVDTVSGNVDNIKEQVTNGGSNLAATVGELKTTLARIESNQREIHTQHLGPMNRNIATLHEGVQGVRDDVAALERKVEERLG